MSFSPKENLLFCFNNQILHHAIKLYPERLSDMEKKKILKCLKVNNINYVTVYLSDSFKYVRFYSLKTFFVDFNVLILHTHTHTEGVKKFTH